MAHRNCMIAAFAASTLFLACYLTYHGYLAFYLHRGPTVFKDPAGFRPIYLRILLTAHGAGRSDCAAGVNHPVARPAAALRAPQEDRPLDLAVWMYVSVTGVVIYLLLYQIFPQQ